MPISRYRTVCCRPRPSSVRAAAIVAAAAMLALSVGCNRNKRQPPPRPRASESITVRDIPAPLRGTVGAEATVRGVQSTLVSGIGFVVGLNGTGGLTMPEQYAAHLEREMGLNGINVSNDGRGGISGKSPRELLRDPNTAAVIVQAAVPPGANNGDSFDIYVRAINASSLEGGQLWTTELRVGPPSSFGDAQARVLGSARGPIFLNPFAEPGAGNLGVGKSVGRVLDGGVVSFPTLIQIMLDNPSHQRARQIASAINSAFPRGPGDSEQTARGKDESVVQVRIPTRYSERREDFIELVKNLPIDQSYPETYARRFSQTMRTDAYLSREMSWGLEAIGERSKPFLTDLYDAPETIARLSALRAGARLNDPRAVSALREIAETGQGSLRIDAIRLLADINAGPVIDDTLRGMLDDPKLAVRVESYEGLIRRAVANQKRRFMLAQAQARRENRLDQSVSISQVDAFARSYVPGGTLFGVSRELVEGKFFLDRVPFGEPLVYISQQGEPRIVIFGDDPYLNSPMLVSAWSDRLLLASDNPGDPVRLYFRDDDERRTVTMDSVPTDLGEFIRFLAHRPTAGDPRPGLGLGYAEIVGVLYELQTDRGMAAAFATENDRLLAELLESTQPESIEVRAEAPGGDITLVAADDPRREVVNRGEGGLVRTRRSLLVPINAPGGSGPFAPQEPAEDAPGGSDVPNMREE